jgi:hypothetical protein
MGPQKLLCAQALWGRSLAGPAQITFLKCSDDLAREVLSYPAVHWDLCSCSELAIKFIHLFILQTFAKCLLYNTYIARPWGIQSGIQKSIPSLNRLLNFSLASAENPISFCHTETFWGHCLVLPDIFEHFILFVLCLETGSCYVAQVSNSWYSCQASGAMMSLWVNSLVCKMVLIC